ncbi:MAG TPA: sigma-54 dependent transcriptional regulator [Gemmatimonadaceae bacterium]|nr:sigma-54 dependent transcriptional regulator [Gemmatimonadaceae bacterium]
MIAEDDESLLALLERYLGGKGHNTVGVRDGTTALAELREHAFDVALVDINMPGLDGLEVLRQMRNEPEPPEVVIMTGDGTVDTAITAVKLGAYDYVTKPYRMEEIEVVVQKAGEKHDLAAENARLHSELGRVAEEERITSHDPRVLSAVQRIAEIAASRSPVLVSGERGTGKDVFIREIHAATGIGQCTRVDADGPTEYDVDSELFGHEAGSHPGANRPRPGALETAGGGTVVISNVHALTPALQEKLLQALLTGRFTRAGGSDLIPLTARVIATTARDLSVAVSAGRFSPVLMSELSAFAVHLPPLRERPGDVTLLANHFLEKHSGSRQRTFDAEAITALSQYSWPGNVVELKNVVERAVMLATDDVIGKDELLVPGISGRSTPTSNLPLAELERQHIQAVLAETNWHQGNAAARLGISSKTLYRKIREYGFVRPRDTQGG